MQLSSTKEINFHCILQAACGCDPSSASVLPRVISIGLNKYRSVNKSCELLSGLTQADWVEYWRLSSEGLSDKKDTPLNIPVQVKSVNNTAFIPQDGDKRLKIPLDPGLALAMCVSINWR